MRALESFHEAERIRLATQSSLRTQRAVEEADFHFARRTASPAASSTTVDTEPDEDLYLGTLTPVRRAIGEEADGSEEIDQPLAGALPETVILDDIVGNYLDFDTIFLILPRVSKGWYRAIWENRSLLWKRLCMRAWIPLNLPFKKTLALNDWQTRFVKRPWLRQTGPYMTYTIYISYPGPRTMWTPKDAPSVKVIYHYRYWWFRDFGKVTYIALSTPVPQKVIELMRKQVMGYNASTSAIQFWEGSYTLQREDGVLTCDVDVPHERHGVKFKFELCPGGEAVKVLRHQSYLLRRPDDLMFHPLPEQEEDRHFHYRPGFL